jgi:catechol 2,3-dioxygenase-like lactoylglutathione lyase family enzyme
MTPPSLAVTVGTNLPSAHAGRICPGEHSGTTGDGGPGDGVPGAAFVGLDGKTQAAAFGNEFRTGLDHIAFGASDRGQIEAWIDHFTSFGVHYSEPIEFGPMASC